VIVRLGEKHGIADAVDRMAVAVLEAGNRDEDQGSGADRDVCDSGFPGLNGETWVARREQGTGREIEG